MRWRLDMDRLLERPAMTVRFNIVVREGDDLAGRVRALTHVWFDPRYHDKWLGRDQNVAVGAWRAELIERTSRGASKLRLRPVEQYAELLDLLGGRYPGCSCEMTYKYTSLWEVVEPANGSRSYVRRVV